MVCSVLDATKPHACPNCGKEYKWRCNMLAHMKRECGKSPYLACPYCPHKTKQKSNLKTHIGSKHSSLIPFK